MFSLSFDLLGNGSKAMAMYSSLEMSEAEILQNNITMLLACFETHLKQNVQWHFMLKCLFFVNKHYVRQFVTAAYFFLLVVLFN